MKPRIERFTIKARTPSTGEPVSRAELCEYIRIALRRHWAWGARMRWSLERRTK